MADEADELYALPLDEFTSARNELEKRLRKDGQRDEAAEVKALRKPTVPAWALNQVARQRAGEVGDLIDAGRRVREAQDELLAGGDREALDRAGSDQRALVRTLMRATVDAGKEGGIGTGAAFEDKVGATLRAAAADDEVGAQLVAGRLEREHEAVGLLGFEAGPAVPARDSPAPKKRAGRAPKKRSAKKKGDDDAEREAAAEERRAEARERKRLKALETASQGRAAGAPRGRGRRAGHGEGARDGRTRGEAPEQGGGRRGECTGEARGGGGRGRAPRSGGRRAVDGGAAGLSRPAQPVVWITTASICRWPWLPWYTGPAALMRSPGPGSGSGRRSLRTSMTDTPGAVIESRDSRTKWASPSPSGSTRST